MCWPPISFLPHFVLLSALHLMPKLFFDCTFSVTLTFLPLCPLVCLSFLCLAADVMSFVDAICFDEASKEIKFTQHLRFDEAFNDLPLDFELPDALLLIAASHKCSCPAETEDAMFHTKMSCCSRLSFGALAKLAHHKHTISIILVTFHTVLVFGRSCSI